METQTEQTPVQELVALLKSELTKISTAVTPYLTTKEAATYLRVSAQQMEIWRVKGGGPKYLKFADRLIRYSRVELEAWADANVKTSTSAY